MIQALFKIHGRGFHLHWLVGDKPVGEPQHHDGLEDGYQEEKVVSKFASSFCDMRLNR